MVSSDWITVSLGKVVTLQRGYDLPNRLRRPGKVPIVTSSGIGGTHNEAMVSGPGVVTGRYGTIGEVFYIENEFWPLNTTLFVQNFHGNDPLFVSYLLRTIDFQTHSGKSGVPGVNRNDLHEVVVALPPTKAEQEAIAEALSNADALIESLEQLIAKKCQIKQGAMQELLTGKKRLQGFATKPGYKQTEVGEIPEDWEIRRIGAVCKLINGRGFKPFEWQKTGLPIIRIQNLNGSDDFNFYMGTYDKKLEVEPGQLLFAWSGSRGTSFGPYIWQGPLGLLNYHTWKVQTHEPEVCKEFFLHALRKLTAFIEGWAHGASALVHVQKWQMEGFLFTFPPALAEQTAIAAILNDMDAEITALEEKLAKARQLKQGMMQELLTGKTRLVEREK